MINRPSPQQRSSPPRRRRLLGVISDRQCCVPRRPTSVGPSSAERVQRPTPADNVTLLAFVAERRPCSDRSIVPGRRARSSKPAATARADRMMGRTNRQTGGGTDRRTLDSFIDPAAHTVRAVSIRLRGKRVSAVADGPARRAVSRASSCTRRWTLGVINWPRSSVERRPSQLLLLTSPDDDRQFVAPSVHSCPTKLTTRSDDRRVVFTPSCIPRSPYS